MTNDEKPENLRLTDAELRVIYNAVVNALATKSETFEQAWSRTGYQYGKDELEGVRLGWNLARGEWKPSRREK